MSGGPWVVPQNVHDRLLLERVRPPDWRNPEPATRYDLVAVGAGTAGLVAAAGAAGLGARVALIERGLMGGDCLNHGCVPSKALLACARVAADARDAGRFGVRIGAGVSVDFPAVMERMRRLRAGLAVNDAAARFRDLGVDVFLGEAAFTGPDRLAVEGRTLAFHRAVITTGGRPAAPPVQGLADAGFLTSETVFSLTALPSRLAIVGGGPIGCEMGQAFARFGSRVTLIHQGARLLPRDDADAGERVRAALERDGVEVLLGFDLARVEDGRRGKRCVAQRGADLRSIEVDSILVAAGRTPGVTGLGLERAGVEFDPRKGVRVDDGLRTTSSRIYAAGDAVAGGQRFTHVADAHARIVIRNALFPGSRKASALMIPWCTYTDPEVARAGHSAETAWAEGVEVQSFTQPLKEVDRAVLEGEEEGFARIHVRAGGGEIVGATIVARHAGEMISEVTLAMEVEAGLSALSRTIHPYPTQAEALRKIGDAYERTRLTPIVRWLIGKWLAWRRSIT